MDKKLDETSGLTEATVPSGRADNAGDGGTVSGPGRRFFAQRKLSAVQRLFRGESLDILSRDLGVPGRRLTEWRDRARAGAEGALQDRCPVSAPMAQI
jgi:transposase-like protein